MNLYLKKLLMPLFRVAAKPGLGNPHTPYETDLMVGGGKPVAIMAPEEITDEMQKCIESGHIVHIDDYEGHKTHRIYCHPSQIDKAEKAACILQSCFQNRKPLSSVQNQFMDSFFEQPLEKNQNIHQDRDNIFQRSFVLEKALWQGQKTPSVDLLLNGKIAALVPIDMSLYPEHETIDKLETSVAKKELKALDIKTVQIVQVFSQKNKVEEGKELYRLYFKGEGDEFKTGQERNAKIGQLLGYTPNDIAWSNGTKYQNPFITKLMYKTMGMRCWARKEVMLYDAHKQSSSLNFNQ